MVGHASRGLVPCSPAVGHSCRFGLRLGRSQSLQCRLLWWHPRPGLSLAVGPVAVCEVGHTQACPSCSTLHLLHQHYPKDPPCNVGRRRPQRLRFPDRVRLNGRARHPQRRPHGGCVRDEAFRCSHHERGSLVVDRVLGRDILVKTRLVTDGTQAFKSGALQLSDTLLGSGNCRSNVCRAARTNVLLA